MAKISMHVDQTLAVLAGKEQWGRIIIDVPLAGLTEAQRKTLLPYTWMYDTERKAGAQWSLPAGKVLLPNCRETNATLPQFAEATPETVAALLDAIAAETERLWAEAVAAEAEAKRKVEESNAMRRAAVATLPAEKLARKGPWCWEPEPEAVMFGREAEARAEADRRNAEDRAREEATKQAKAKAEEDARQARLEQIGAWLSAHGTDNQKARWEDGLLPEKEVVDAIRDEAFAPLNDQPRYSSMTLSQLCTCGEDCDEDEDEDDASCELQCNVEEMDELTATEYDVLVWFREKMPGATVTPRRHKCSTSRCYSTEERRSLHVKITVGAFTFAREYAM